MANEVDTAMNIIVQCGRGACRVGGASLKFALWLSHILVAARMHSIRDHGGVSSYGQFVGVNNKLHELGMSEGHVHFLNIGTENPAILKDIENIITEHGARAGRLPDFNIGDGFTQYAFDDSQAYLMNVAIAKINKKYSDIRIYEINGETYQETAFKPDGTPTKEAEEFDRAAAEAARNHEPEKQRRQEQKQKEREEKSRKKSGEPFTEEQQAKKESDRRYEEAKAKADNTLRQEQKAEELKAAARGEDTQKGKKKKEEEQTQNAYMSDEHGTEAFPANNEEVVARANRIESQAIEKDPGSQKAKKLRQFFLIKERMFGAKMENLNITKEEAQKRTDKEYKEDMWLIPFKDQDPKSQDVVYGLLVNQSDVQQQAAGSKSYFTYLEPGNHVIIAAYEVQSGKMECVGSGDAQKAGLSLSNPSEPEIKKLEENYEEKKKVKVLAEIIPNERELRQYLHRDPFVSLVYDDLLERNAKKEKDKERTQVKDLAKKKDQDGR